MKEENISTQEFVHLITTRISELVYGYVSGFNPDADRETLEHMISVMVAGNELILRMTMLKGDAEAEKLMNDQTMLLIEKIRQHHNKKDGE